ncbi:hypothetical protein KC669_01400 [Candidatus Dojkabacteria bacterium]|uniref:Tellurite resistance methyltransferase TehB-like domain-containing protein n=1 Tax=Candidatus Dojkabacteria bacterium TaxID=2099670 RepID=A0A955LAP2_9BACT|nr:hypothetical protein [Candidatus Dojkabacteria bacterium]
MGVKQSFFETHISIFNKNLPVLEIGTGKGKEAKYLADLGFQVTTIDPNSNINDSRITEINQKFEAIENNILPVGNVIAFFSLHFIDKIEVNHKLDFLIEKVPISSVHMFIDFLPQPPLYPNGNEKKFFFTDETINDLYSNWTVLVDKIEDMKTYNGEFQASRFLVLQKYANI